jgi:hypothetical protein
MSETCFIYELFCVNPSVADKYLGYTTNIEQCMYFHEKRSEDRDQILKSTLYFTIHNTGGWSNWNVDILQTVKGRKKALNKKLKILQENIEEYTLNTHINSLKPVYRVRRDNTQVLL